MTTEVVKDIVGWDNLDAMVRKLADELRPADFDLMLAITRGGLVPAGMLAYRLGIRNILVAAVEFYDDEGKPGPRPTFLQFPADPSSAASGSSSSTRSGTAARRSTRSRSGSARPAACRRRSCCISSQADRRSRGHRTTMRRPPRTGSSIRSKPVAERALNPRPMSFGRFPCLDMRWPLDVEELA